MVKNTITPKKAFKLATPYIYIRKCLNCDKVLGNDLQKTSKGYRSKRYCNNKCKEQLLSRIKKTFSSNYKYMEEIEV